MELSGILVRPKRALTSVAFKCSIQPSAGVVLRTLGSPPGQDRFLVRAVGTFVLLCLGERKPWPFPLNNSSSSSSVTQSDNRNVENSSTLPPHRHLMKTSNKSSQSELNYRGAMTFTEYKHKYIQDKYGVFLTPLVKTKPSEDRSIHSCVSSKLIFDRFTVNSSSVWLSKLD